MLPWDSSYMQICPLNQPPSYVLVFIVIPIQTVPKPFGKMNLTFPLGLGAQVTSRTMST